MTPRRALPFFASGSVGVPTAGRAIYRAQGISLLIHGLLALLLGLPLFSRLANPTTTRLEPSVSSQLIFVARPSSSGGGHGKTSVGDHAGGGQREAGPATAGRLARFANIQWTPPSLARNQNPKLAAEPTLLGAIDMRPPEVRLPDFGDPRAQLLTRSGGPGSGNGFGSGCCGGVGDGDGRGGYGDGAPGAGWSAGTHFPECEYCPNPTFSDQARESKVQGVVVLNALVLPDGSATNIAVLRGPGAGLNERAIEAVRNWRFKPATDRAGTRIPMSIAVEVSFRLL